MKTSRRAPEGKTLADPGKTRKCDNCDAPNGQYYCKECNFVYCPVCEKGHKRNKFTDHHKSTPLADISVSNLEGKMSALNLGTCTRHNKTITNTCHTCMTVICDDCVASHSGHEVRPCSNDGRIIQKICRAQTQSLYDALEMTENNQDCARKRKSLCDQTRKKIRETVTLIIDEATKLGKSIEKDLDKIEQEGDDKEIEVAAYAKKVDTKIARLTSIRNVTDASVLVPEAAETVGILDELEDFKNMAAYLDIRDVTVSDVLPDIGTVDKLLDDMKIALHMNDTFGNKSKSGLGAVGVSKPRRASTRIKNYRYDLVNELGTIPINNNTETMYHRICDSGRNTKKHIVFHGSFETDIRKFNPKTGFSETTECEYGSWNMVETADGKYVALDSTCQKLLIFDNKFKVKHTMPESDTIQAICYHSLNTFLMLQNDSANPNTATLTQVEVKSNNFVKRQKVEVTTKDNPLFMCLHPDVNKLYMVSSTYMYIVNMAHRSVETQDLSGSLNVGYCRSLYVDEAGNMLVGDDEGVLHLFDRDMEHRVVAEVGEQINGVTVREDVLYVTAGGEIHKYRVPRG